MSQKANPALIGTFVIGAITFLVIAILLFGSMQLFASKKTYICFFKDSVNGLDVGAPVKLKGVPIGYVTKIMLHYNQGKDTTHIPVLIELDQKRINSYFKSRAPHAHGDLLDIEINHGLRAKLVHSSIVTGVLFVELDYIEDPSPPIFIQQKYVYEEIPTVSSGISQAFQDFGSIGKKLDSVLTNLDNGLKEFNFKQISDSVVGAANSVRKFFDSDKLGRGFSNFDAMLDPNSEFRYELSEAIENFSEASKSVRDLARMLDRTPDALLKGKTKDAQEY